MNTEYLLAKFAPDLRRMEPVNIGVIAWSNGLVGAKFIGEDGSVPKYVGVNDKQNYLDWIASWRRQLGKRSLELDDGSFIEKASEQYLQSLLEWSSGNYMLVRGGSCVTEYQDVSEIVATLYSQLVVRKRESSKQEAARLKATSKALIIEAGIDKMEGFKEGFPVWYEPYGIQRQMEFDFGVGPTKLPNSVFQHVNLAHQVSFDATISHLDWFERTHDYDKKRCAAMVVIPDDITKKISDNLDAVKSVATVVPVNSPKEAKGLMIKVAKMGLGA